MVSSRIRKILDSRGNPTVEVEVFVEGGFGMAAAPSGASTGAHEVITFPEKGIDASIDTFRKEVAPKMVGMDAMEQPAFDNWLHEIDGTENFSRIGGSVSIAASLAVARAAAHASKTPFFSYVGAISAEPLPRPMGNMIGGGAHGVGGTDIQEFLSIALGPTFRESVFANAIVHKTVKKKLIDKLPDHAIGKGDEGAWLASITNEDALNILSEACGEVSSEVGFDCRLGLDMAASEFFSEGKYRYRDGDLSSDEQVDFVAEIVEAYDLFSVEDPFHEEDFEAFARLTEEVGDKCFIIGDDLFVTSITRLKRGVEMMAGNAILIKPNQIGTVTDMIETVDYARKNGFQTVMSHRSGETTDDSIAHLAVAFGCIAIKTGAVGGERTAKLNELIRIEEIIESGGM